MAVKWRKSAPAVPPLRRCAAAAFLLPLLLFVLWNLAPRTAGATCKCEAGDRSERFMWYAPHSGFSNQIGELRNALRVAAILGRTLVVPPVTDHHALSLGSCPKYRIVQPSDLRRAVWSHFSELLAQSRYYSIADVLNISSVSPEYVRTIDLREFALAWCGADIKQAASFNQCGSAFTEVDPACSNCVQAIDHSCASTVWTFRRASSSRRSLLAKPKLKKFTGARVGVDIWEALGSHTEAGKARVLSFGSLFSGEYDGAQTHVDIRAPSGDKRFDEVFQRSEYFPFVNEILEAGKLFVEQRMRKQPFFCAQLRLLDGQFKNHWTKSFQDLSSSLRTVEGSAKTIFLMTDLPLENRTGTYLEELHSKYEVFELTEEDQLVTATAGRILTRNQGSGTGSGSLGVHVSKDTMKSSDFLLYLQEAVCSCATIGFQGTMGSTITKNILQMRNARSCTT